jgi:hypothetical protein
MRRVFVVSLAGFALSGCASFSVPGLDFLTPAPPVATLQLESMPAGAEARTSAGPACRTPCSVSVPANQPLTVTYTLDRYMPQTVPVQPIQQTVVNPNVEAGSATVIDLDPNPVFAQLAPAAPPKRVKRAPPKRVAKRPPPDAPAPQAATPFPPTPFPSR